MTPKVITELRPLVKDTPEAAFLIAPEVKKPAARRPAKKAKKPGDPSGNPFLFVLTYLKQVVAELRKVIWPNRKQMGSYTSVVLAFLVLVFLSVFDLIHALVFDESLPPDRRLDGDGNDRLGWRQRQLPPAEYGRSLRPVHGHLGPHFGGY